MNVSKNVVLLVFALISTMLDAASLSPEYGRCVARGSSNENLRRCSKEEVERQEKRLNEVWKGARDSLDTKAGKDELLKEQLVWIKWKDASCYLYSNREEYGMEGSLVHWGACRSKIIAERIEYLENIAYRGARGGPRW